MNGRIRRFLNLVAKGPRSLAFQAKTPQGWLAGQPWKNG